MPRVERWASIWNGCARLSCVPWIAGAVVLVVTRGTTNWIPPGIVFFACWTGLALVISSLFGLIALRRRHAEEKLPWSRSTFWFAVVGLIGSLFVGTASVLVLDKIDVHP